MNNVLSFLLIGSFCFVGTKLKVVESSFTEIAPGIATGYVVTQFEVKIKSTGRKKISIDEVWLNNHMATWQLLNADDSKVESINDKNFFVIKGEIKTRAKGAEKMTKSGIEKERATFDEAFVIVYSVNNASDPKYLKIQEIENLRSLKKK